MKVDDSTSPTHYLSQMTYVGQFLKSYFQRTGTDQRQLAAKAALDEGHLSKNMKGGRKLLYDKTLGAILKALPAKDRGAFLEAYWLDNTPEEFHAFVTKGINIHAIAEEAATYSPEDEGFQDLEATIKKHFRPPNRKRILEILKMITIKGGTKPKLLQAIEFFASDGK